MNASGEKIEGRVDCFCLHCDTPPRHLPFSPLPAHPHLPNTPHSILTAEIERLKAGELDGKLKEVAAQPIPARFKRILALPGLGLPPPPVLSETEEEDEEEEGSEEEEDESAVEGSEAEGDEDDGDGSGEDEDEDDEEPRRGRRQRRPSAKVSWFCYSIVCVMLDMRWFVSLTFCSFPNQTGGGDHGQGGGGGGRGGGRGG